MVFILPDKGVSPRDLLSTPEKVKEVFEGGESIFGMISWKIPKFKFHTECGGLIPSLNKLGVKSAFDRSGADFTGITDMPAYISNIRQETHIAIDEKGVEASAFTMIGMKAGGAPPQDKADMILDRPFIFGIERNGVLLFIGICENPTA